MTSALVLFAHGARDPEWAVPFHKLRERIAARRPGDVVELAFLELMEPALEPTVNRLAADGVARITVVPLFMAQGGHLKHDLPLLLARVRATHPALALTLAPPVGDVEPVLDAIVGWASTL
ncbi:MAG: sirohydrochlorin chelatase [Burkholderiales bacterium]